MIDDLILHDEPWDPNPGRGCARVVAAVATAVTVVAMLVWGIRPVLRVTVGPIVLAGIATLAVWGLLWTRRQPDEYSAITERCRLNQTLKEGR